MRYPRARVLDLPAKARAACPRRAGAPTSWTASGRPVRGETGGDRRGGLAGRVPEHAERHPAALPQVGRPSRRGPPSACARDRGRGHDRHQQHVEVVPQRGRRARAIRRSASSSRSTVRSETSAPGPRDVRACGARAAAGARSRRTMSRIPRNMQRRGSPGTSRARKSGSRSTTSWPRSRSSVRGVAQRGARLRRRACRACRGGNASE